MKRISILDIYKNKIKIKDFISVYGWIRSRRDSKSGISFINLHDGSHFNSIQIIVKSTLHNYYTEIIKLTVGCSIMIYGQLVLSLGEKQKYEVVVKKLKVIGWVDRPDVYPISAKRHTVEHLRNFLHLRARTNFISSITRIRHVLAYELHSFLNKNGYFWLPTPIITGNNTEGAGAMFRVSTLDLNSLPNNKFGKIDFKQDFFKKEMFLTVSGQLTAETYACAMSKIYTFGPTFRAENSNTTRHLAEFWMLEVEQAFSDLKDISEFVEIFLKHVVQMLLKKCLQELEFFSQYFKKDIIKHINNFIETRFIQINYSEAIDILKKSYKQFNMPISTGIDLSSDHEKYLCEKYFQAPVIIKNYPKELKAFYMRVNDDNKTVAAMDVIFPSIGEIIGGSQREERKVVLDARMCELGLNFEDYGWYRDIRRYGTVPHSGFGLGFERLICYLTGIKNIKDVIPFPRTINNAEC